MNNTHSKRTYLTFLIILMLLPQAALAVIAEGIYFLKSQIQPEGRYVYKRYQNQDGTYSAILDTVMVTQSSEHQIAG